MLAVTHINGSRARRGTEILASHYEASDVGRMLQSVDGSRGLSRWFILTEMPDDSPHGSVPAPDSPDSGLPATLFDLGVPEACDFGSTAAQVAAATKGGEQAFERLWQRYRPALEILLAGKFRSSLDPILRSRLESEMEDILQEVALEVHKRLRTFEYRGEGSLLAWMATIATRKAKDRAVYWKADRRRPHQERPFAAGKARPAGSESSRGSQPLDPRPRPSTQAELAEKRRKVAVVLAKLSDRDHDIVLLRFFAGAEWEEIASEIGATSGEAVKKECFRRILPAIATALRAGSV